MSAHPLERLRQEQIASGTRKPTQQNRQNQRGWTAHELNQLRTLGYLGAQAVADVLGRSVHSVRQAARRNRISLRTSGERGGLVMGQPRYISYLKDPKLAPIRAKVLGEPAYALVLEQLVGRTKRLAEGVPLCQMCGENPEEVEKSKFCLDCHKKDLVEKHEQEEELQRKVWAVRQNKIRRRQRES